MLKIMPLGDSITFGYTQTGVGAPYVENGYRGELWAWLRDKGVEPNFVGSCGGTGCPDNPWPVNNRMGDWNHEGHAGMTTLELVAPAVATMSAELPDVVLSLSGANDLRLDHTPEQYKADLHTLMSAIHEVRADTHIFLASPTFKGHEPDWPAYVQAVQQVVAEHRVHISYVPLDKVGQSKTQPGTAHTGELCDGCHPTKCGYSRMAALWFEYMKRHPIINPTGAGLTPPGSNWPAPYWPWNTATGPCKGVV